LGVKLLDVGLFVAAVHQNRNSLDADAIDNPDGLFRYTLDAAKLYNCGKDTF